MAIADDTAFVGRGGELETLQQGLSDARIGVPRLIVVEGEPGIGKTALLRRFLQLNPDVSRVWVSGDETETSLRFGVVDQLRLAAGGSPAPNNSSAAADSFTIGAELLNLLGGAADGDPFVVVLDDLHWVDPDSARALLFWLRRLSRDSVMVLCAARPQVVDVLGESWARLIADRDRSRLIRIGGLSAAEIAELAAAEGTGLPARTAERLREHTAGNPLYVSGLLTELSVDALRDPNGALPAPRSYAATVLARAATLSLSARALLAAAAVVGVRCALNLATNVAGLESGDAALDEAVSHRLLAVSRRGPATELSFPHPLIRAAIYQDLSPATRRRLHLAAAAGLPADAAVTHRVAAADGPDAALAAELAAAADIELGDGFAEDAARHLLWSAEVEPVRADAEGRLLRAVELMLISGDVVGAWKHQPAVANCPASSHRTWVLGALAAARGDLLSARELFEQTATPDLLQSDARLYAMVRASLALVQLVLGEPEDAINQARTALEVDEAPAFMRSVATESLALGLAHTARMTEALATLAPFSNVGIAPAPFEVDLIVTRGRIRAWVGDWAAARSDLRAAISWTKSGYPVTSIASAYAFLAEAEARSGEWDDAVAHAELAASLGHDLDHGWYLALSHDVATQLYCRIGEDEFARTHAGAARDAVASAPHPLAAAHASSAEAAVAAAHGNWDRVLTILTPMLSADSDGLAHPALSRARTLVTQAFIETGHTDRAHEALQRPWLPPDEPDRCRLRARMFAASGHLDAALSLIAETAVAAAVDADPHAAALLQICHGQLLIADGDRRGALAPLRAAHESLSRLGARPALAECDAALAAAGETAAAGAGSPLAGLTRREQVVARLAGRGLTNREIATELYLSTKTIEYHLGNIFTKLGISTRRQLRDRQDFPAGVG